MRTPRGKLLLAIIGAIAVLGLGGWAVLRGQNRVEYRTAKVERGEIEATISATGNPNAVVTVQVGSQVSGNIKELHADFNTKVKKGQLVARIDPEIFEAKVNQAKGNLDNAKAAVLNARAMLQKTEADVANAKASLEAAKANVAKAKVAVLDAQIKLKSRIDLYKEGGISAEERRHIFEPFYSTKPPGRGTGLGLAICREIASALKGRIDVDTEPGAGSTFTLVIPAPALRAAG